MACCSTRRLTDASSQDGLDSGLELKTIVHEIRIQNQVIYLDPPIEQARASWYRQLHQWLGIVCGLSRIQSSRYEIGLKIRTTTPQNLNYNSLVRSFAFLALSGS